MTRINALILALLILAGSAAAEELIELPAPEPYTDYNIAKEMPACCVVPIDNLGACCADWWADNWGPFPPDLNGDDGTLEQEPSLEPDETPVDPMTWSAVKLMYR